MQNTLCDIIKNFGQKFTKRDLLRLCKLPPEQQKEAAKLIASGEIKGIDEYEAAQAIEQEVHCELSYAEDIVMLLSDFSKSARKIRNELEKYRSKLYEDAMATNRFRRSKSRSTPSMPPWAILLGWSATELPRRNRSKGHPRGWPAEIRISDRINPYKTALAFAVASRVGVLLMVKLYCAASRKGGREPYL